MSHADIEKLKSVKDFEGLVEYLTYELDWPIEADNAEDATFEYNAPEELGIESGHAAKIKTIKQIRPLTDTQPWGVFYIEFEPKRLPVVVLRRILRSLVTSKRGKSDGMATWDMEDLLFITTSGEIDERTVSVARFSQTGEGLPDIRAVSWDETDTYFHYKQNIFDLDKLRWPSREEDVDAWREQWKSAFSLKYRDAITTSRRLATEMARLARRIRERIKIVYQYETRDGPLHRLHENFRSVLIHDLTVADFADMYAQTVAYGLFSARCTHEGDFSVNDVSAMVPNTNPFLKKLFEECTRIGEYSRDTIDLEELGVSELVEMLKLGNSNIEAVLQDFGKQKKGEDPVMHFYELFLEEYDRDRKVKRGVFYTPDPVVSFIVRSVDCLLRTEFDCPDGLADVSTGDVEQVHKVQILDPAAGTGTFLKHVIAEIKKTFDETHRGLGEEELSDKWNEYVPEHLLPRVFGFELMMAPYAVAHLKLGLELKETGYDFKSEKRLGVYLTNTLEGTHKGGGTLDAYFNWLAEEVDKANTVKAKPILAIIGNPPYSVSSQNKGEWINELIKDYKKDLNEKKISLDDDFIKFIRFGQWKIDRTGFGILAFITNHTFIDGLTHRRMRESLMQSFDKIYIMDLHGNVMEQKKSPDGGKDDNVFDIQQGVSIGIFVKSRNKGLTKVYHRDILGNREDKYNLLLNSRIDTIEWTELKPEMPYFFFVSKDFNIEEEYVTYIPIDEIFINRSYGIQTKRDSLFIYFSENELEERLSEILKYSSDPETVGNKFEIANSSGWNVDKLRNLKYNKKFIQPIEYRPFDFRKIYYDPKALGRARYNTICHMLKENIGLVLMRQVFQDYKEYNHFGITNTLTDERTFYSNRGGTYLFPLYVYNGNNRKTNISREFIQIIESKIGLSFVNGEGDLRNNFGPYNLLSYIYSTLYSRIYRAKYAEFLKIDFPRIPLTSNKNLFKTLSRLGSELVSLHLMESPKLDDLITEFRGGGDNVVATIGKNSYKDGRLKINKTQYFEGMPEEVYNFHIGGYQVCQKWLKDRKGRALSEEDILHYQKIVVALNETIRIMKEIDAAIEGHGGWPIR